VIGQTVSHYKILERLGGGGMGVVYKAQDVKLDRPVALKFLPPDLTWDPVARERFLVEAKAVSALQHNNICAIHDIDQTGDGEMFICMDYYEGETLKTMLERAPTEPDSAGALAGQLALGLAEAHRHGIVHRDIKPANIFVTRQGVVKILDFGLAKLADATRKTRTDATAGTPAYMSPEQVRGEAVDQRTDIWSFGVVLYELLTGRRPFTGEHVLAVMYSISNEDPAPPSSIRHDVPGELSALCMRCLRKNPQERPAGFSDIPLGQDRTARPPGRLHRLMKSLPLPVRWGTLVVIPAIIALVARLLLPSTSISLEKTDSVVVADFENRTGYPVLDHALTQGLKVSLRQSERVNLLSSDRVAAARVLLKVPEARPLDERTALSVARREGARAVISPSISKLGSVYVLAGGVIDASTGETVKILYEEVPNIESVLEGLDKLCTGLRKTLGESLAQISEAGLPLEQVTTPSLEALDLYSRGHQHAAEGKYAESALLLEKSVAIDSQFVAAISDLAYAYRKIGMDRLAALQHKRILPLIHRATERERLEILSIYYGPSFEMDFPRAYELLRQLTVKYNPDAYALATLGHLAMFAGDTEGALEANARAIALLPSYDKVCYNNWAFALALDSRPDEALTLFRKAKALRPEYAAIDNYMALVYWMKDEYDSARSILRQRWPGADPYSRNKMRVILSCLDYSCGRFASARKIALEGIRECVIIRNPGDEAYFHIILGEIAAAEGRVIEHRTHMASAIALSASPYFELALAGISYARWGFGDDAEDIVRRIRAAQSYDPYFVRYRPGVVELVRGYIDFAGGRIDQARRHFDGVARVRAGDPFFLLARKGAADCAALSADTSAARMYEFVLAQRGDIMMASLSSIRQTGPWTRWLWPELCLDVAKFSFDSHNIALARHSLDAAVRHWKFADTTDRRAAEARALFLRIREDL
jgi:eukaryotic-like serine/threonine-protein kinase